jgi:hypothetical protein
MKAPEDQGSAKTAIPPIPEVHGRDAGFRRFSSARPPAADPAPGVEARPELT